MTVLDRSDAAATIPEEVADEIVNDLPSYSAVAGAFRQVPMSTGQTRMPVLSSLAVAYFVNGEASNDPDAPADAGYKRATRAAWANKHLNAEEIAAIIPIPIATVEDSSFDLVEFSRTNGSEAIAAVLDGAVLFGTNRPASWGTSVLQHATAAGHVVQIGTNGPDKGGIAEDFSQAFGLIEEDGFNPTAVMGSTRLKALLRGARDANGNRLTGVSVTEIDGAEVSYGAQGEWPAGTRALVADPNQGVLGVRKDITADILREGVIQDPATGEILYNLGQQNMVAVRLSARFAWQVANTVRRDQKGKAASGVSPFAALNVAGS